MLIYGESLLELAIRIGIADLAANPEEITQLLGISPGRNAGLDLTPDGAPVKVYDRTLLDEFQDKVDALARLKGEEGLRPVFRNAIPDLPDIKAYVQSANVRIAHGYPREAQDLPMVAISLGSESEGQQYLGVLKTEKTGQAGSGDQIMEIGSDMETDYHIHILTPNYDETVILFYLIKYGLLKYRPHLEGYGLRDAKMNWQACEPAPEYLQGGLFIYQRSCVLSCVKDESFAVKAGAGSKWTALGFNAQAGGDTIIPGTIIGDAP